MEIVKRLQKLQETVSSANVAALSLKLMEPKDLKVLRALVKTVRTHRITPFRVIEALTSLPRDEVAFRVDRLNSFGYVITTPQGCLVVSPGLDALALSIFVKKGSISGLGQSLGVGKEADVYAVQDDAGRSYSLKLFRIGRTSFRDVRRTRTYSDMTRQHQWLSICIDAATKEQRALEKLYPLNVHTPKPLGKELHAILLSKIEGSRLVDWQKVPQPAQLLRRILTSLRLTYTKGKIVNGDISEYNIMFDGHQFWIIDWPQWTPIGSITADRLIKRDVFNICNFFTRRFMVKVNVEEAVRFVSGASATILIRLPA